MKSCTLRHCLNLGRVFTLVFLVPGAFAPFHAMATPAPSNWQEAQLEHTGALTHLFGTLERQLALIEQTGHRPLEGDTIRDKISTLQLLGPSAKASEVTDTVSAVLAASESVLAEPGAVDQLAVLRRGKDAIMAAFNRLVALARAADALAAPTILDGLTARATAAQCRELLTIVSSGDTGGATSARPAIAEGPSP